MTQLCVTNEDAEGTWPEKQYCVDNGTMIAELGRRMLQTQGPTSFQASAINPSLRTDHTIVTWD